MVKKKKAPAPRRQWSNKDTATLKTLAADGANVADIARRLKRSPSVIYSQASARGISFGGNGSSATKKSAPAKPAKKKTPGRKHGSSAAKRAASKALAAAPEFRHSAHASIRGCDVTVSYDPGGAKPAISPTGQLKIPHGAEIFVTRKGTH